jgi:ABC-2 type transport system permease protein
MEKILLIIQREYITRVRKKAFIIMTLLVPALVAALFAIIRVIAENKDETTHVINVVDSSGMFRGKFSNSKYTKYIYSSDPLAIVKRTIKSDDDLVLFIPADPKATVQVFAKKKTTLGMSDQIAGEMNDIVTGQKW